MPTYTIYALGESQISISGGGQLSGITQGDGSHMAGRFITLNSGAWEAMDVFDSDPNFDDSDSSQRLDGNQNFDGTAYTNNSVVEAEYQMTLRDPDGNTYTVLGFNINEGGGGASYATVEGLAFVGGVGGFPPRDVPLEVIATREGPSHRYTTLATPPCFTPGAWIETPGGPVLIEDLAVGDPVQTLDHGAQPIRWIGRSYLPRAALARNPDFRPILVAKDALGPGQPCRDIALSPQHRVLITDWRAEYFFGEAEILVPVKKLINDASIRRDRRADEVTYIHLLFDRHEIIIADGLPSESYLPETGDDAVRAPATMDETLRLFPAIARQNAPHRAARRCVADRRLSVLRRAS